MPSPSSRAHSRLAVGGGALVAAALLGGLVVPPATAATAAPVPSSFAVNSGAKALADAGKAGSSITEMQVLGDELYTGYGDWTQNSGPTDLISVNMTTGSATKHLTVDGEAFDKLRIYDGAIYVPDIDPKVSWTANAGYATNVNGAWQYNAATPFVHVLDVAKIGKTLFLAGSIVNPDKRLYGPNNTIAAIKSSTDGGKTWKIEKARWSGTETDELDRYYWLSVVGDTLYAQAEVDRETLTAAKATRATDVWRNGSWSTTSAPPLINAYQELETFAGRIVSDQSSRVLAGSNPVEKHLANGLQTQMTDIFIDGATAYAVKRLTGFSTVYTSTNGRDWTELGAVQGNYTSIAVKGSTLFLGAAAGKIDRIDRSALTVKTADVVDRVFANTASLVVKKGTKSAVVANALRTTYTVEVSYAGTRLYVTYPTTVSAVDTKRAGTQVATLTYSTPYGVLTQKVNVIVQ